MQAAYHALPSRPPPHNPELFRPLPYNPECVIAPPSPVPTPRPPHPPTVLPFLVPLSLSPPSSPPLPSPNPTTLRLVLLCHTALLSSFLLSLVLLLTAQCVPLYFVYPGGTVGAWQSCSVCDHCQLLSSSPPFHHRALFQLFRALALLSCASVLAACFLLALLLQRVLRRHRAPRWLYWAASATGVVTWAATSVSFFLTLVLVGDGALGETGGGFGLSWALHCAAAVMQTTAVGAHAVALVLQWARTRTRGAEGAQQQVGEAAQMTFTPAYPVLFAPPLPASWAA